MIKKASTCISLTGGLGNQLFQLAAGLFVAQGGKLELTNYFGRPRSNSMNVPDLLEFDGLPASNRLIERQEAGYLARKSIGYLLRSGIAPAKWEQAFLVRNLAALATSIFSSLALKEWRRMFASTEIGFDPQLSGKHRGKLLVGYFQSYHYCVEPKILLQLRTLRLNRSSEWLEEMRRTSKEEAPIVLHVRLTDYVNQSFGIPSEKYYEQAVKVLRDQGANGRLWIFSDDIPAAIRLLPRDITENARLVLDPPGATPVETLEVMRLGFNYVIANSTYSWWAAFLSHNNPMVVYPDPWFIDDSKIRGLCPPEWIPLTY